MFHCFLRGSFIALVMIVATYPSIIISRFVSFRVGVMTLGLLCLVGIVVVGLDLLVRNKQITTISVLFFGLLIGRPKCQRLRRDSAIRLVPSCRRLYWLAIRSAVD